MKPFNLEAAKKGAEVCTRDGRDARIICFNLKHDTYSFVALVSSSESEEYPISYTKEGLSFPDCEDSDDLFMKPIKITKWTNLYTNSEDRLFVEGVYENEKEAKNNIIKAQLISYIATSKVEWEE